MLDMDDTLLVKLAQNETDQLPKTDTGEAGYQSAKFAPAAWTLGGRVD